MPFVHQIQLIVAIFPNSSPFKKVDFLLQFVLEHCIKIANNLYLGCQYKAAENKNGILKLKLSSFLSKSERKSNLNFVCPNLIFLTASLFWLILNAYE